MIHPTGHTGHPLREKEPQITTPRHPYHDRKVARIQEQLRDSIDESRLNRPGRETINPWLYVEEVESLLVHIDILERAFNAAIDIGAKTFATTSHERDDAGDRALGLAKTLERVLAQPRWLSIGSANNTAELHLTRNAYYAALTLARAEFGPPPPSSGTLTITVAAADEVHAESRGDGVLTITVTATSADKVKTTWVPTDDDDQGRGDAGPDGLGL